MVVLYNTPEFVPDEFAPYDATLPGNAEEVSEQAAAVEILAPTHVFFTTPNHQGADFDGWIERADRSSSRPWDASTRRWSRATIRARPRTGRLGDRQRRQGALDLHGVRAAPAGAVRRPGAYRILANLISN